MDPSTKSSQDKLQDKGKTRQVDEPSPVELSTAAPSDSAAELQVFKNVWLSFTKAKHSRVAANETQSNSRTSSEHQGKPKGPSVCKDISPYKGKDKGRSNNGSSRDTDEKTRGGGGEGVKPTAWYCGHCGHGPCRISIDTHCISCGRQRDCYSREKYG